MHINAMFMTNKLIVRQLQALANYGRFLPL